MDLGDEPALLSKTPQRRVKYPPQGEDRGVACAIPSKSPRPIDLGASLPRLPAGTEQEEAG